MYGKIKEYNITFMAKIYWAGRSCFEISFSNSKDHEAEIIISPKNSGNILIKAPKGEPFIIEGPREYEVKGVFVRGLPPQGGASTIYIIEAEDI